MDLNVFVLIAGIEFLLLVVTAWLLARLYRRHLVMRHLFIASSDWCAREIERVVECATLSIANLAIERVEAVGSQLTEQEARDYVPVDILAATSRWQGQADQFQAQLRRNGMRPLDTFDLDLPFLMPRWLGIRL